MKKLIKSICICLVIRVFPDLEKTLEDLLEDSKYWAEDWSRDYDKYDYVKNAKSILKLIKKS